MEAAGVCQIAVKFACREETPAECVLVYRVTSKTAIQAASHVSYILVNIPELFVPKIALVIDKELNS